MGMSLGYAVPDCWHTTDKPAEFPLIGRAFPTVWRAGIWLIIISVAWHFAVWNTSVHYSIVHSHKDRACLGVELRVLWHALFWRFWGCCWIVPMSVPLTYRVQRSLLTKGIIVRALSRDSKENKLFAGIHCGFSWIRGSQSERGVQDSVVESDWGVLPSSAFKKHVSFLPWTGSRTQVPSPELHL